MLPVPTFTFTIPSVHDEIPLDCRVYNPPHCVINSVEVAWKARGAVIAHPYPPMGGCYDDPVVLSAAAEFLRQGFVVGTFNFRGAGSSKGRTSWQAKPEIEDYISFAAFFIHYVEGLRTISSDKPEVTRQDLTLSPTSSMNDGFSGSFDEKHYGMMLVLGGYSYGSLITRHLPTTREILGRFASLPISSAVAEIRLRAINLAAQWNKDARIYREAQRALGSESNEKLRASAHTMAVIMGGDESERSSRHSHDGRRSLDVVRRSMDRSRKKLRLRQHSNSSGLSDCIESLEPVRIALPQTNYLLISPLLPPISVFATMFSSMHLGKSMDSEHKFVRNPTLAIYGDDDFFTSQRRLCRWVEGLKARPDSQFDFREVPGAGHFWREEGSDSRMRCGIKDWIHTVLGRDLSGE